MTDPQTPATEAGRRLLADITYPAHYTERAVSLVLAIEAEARADEHARYDEDWALATRLGRADALREAADAVRALQGWKAGTLPGIHDTVPRAAVLAILDPQP